MARETVPGGLSVDEGDVLEESADEAGSGEDVHHEEAVEIRHDMQSRVSEPYAPQAAQLRVCTKVFRTFFSFISGPGVPRVEATVATRPPPPFSSVAGAWEGKELINAKACFLRSFSPMLVGADCEDVV